MKPSTDFLKRTTVATSGFVSVMDPHRMTGSDNTDPRLGPYTPPAGALPGECHREGVSLTKVSRGDRI